MKRCIILCVVAVLMLIILVAVVLGLTVRQNTPTNTPTFKTTFMERCEKFKGTHQDQSSRYDCQKVWGLFEGAYVGRDPCKVPTEAYDPLLAAVPFKHECNRKIFWSKTKDVVHNLTQKRDCFYTVEESLLGSVLDGLTWCGKEGSSETFTTGCPGWTDCPNNAVRSFWNRVSAAFADAACGDVTVMLNGSIVTPFDPTSVFASIEVKRFRFPRVKRLNVVLVTQENSVTNCTNASLKDLKKELDQGMKYDCKKVPEAQIEECSSNLEIPCESLW